MIIVLTIILITVYFQEYYCQILIDILTYKEFIHSSFIIQNLNNHLSPRKYQRSYPERDTQKILRVLTRNFFFRPGSCLKQTSDSFGMLMWKSSFFDASDSNRLGWQSRSRRRVPVEKSTLTDSHIQAVTKEEHVSGVSARRYSIVSLAIRCLIHGWLFCAPSTTGSNNK